MARPDDLEQLYDDLTLLSRRSRELSNDLHPGLTLVAYTLLSYVDAHPDARASDLASVWGLDKSTVSRQLTNLVDAELLRRRGERPGRRGQALELTDAGRTALDLAARSVRDLLVTRLDRWSDADVTAFAGLMRRFNAEAGEAGAGSGDARAGSGDARVDQLDLESPEGVAQA